MKYRWDNRYLHWGVTIFLVAAACMLFYYGIFHMKSLVTGIRTFFNVMAPIIYGLAIAYLLSSVVNFLENRIVYPAAAKFQFHWKKRSKKVARWTCVLISLFFLLVLIYTLVMMLLPELIRSITNVINNFPHYMRVVEEWLNSVMNSGWSQDQEAVEIINKYTIQAQNYLTTTLLPQLQSMLLNISSGVFDVLEFLKNFLIGAIVSLYVLADKERFIAKSKMIVYAILPGNAANSLVHSMRFTHQTFSGFINGKIVDSAIIGVLCYIGTMLLDIPYAVLVSVIVGVTNVIPFFGPYLGAIPCGVLILLISPIKCLSFSIFILILQQFDGNILGPKILGESTGLSSFMVIVAIMIGGGLFGIPGMIVGVPVCAVIYAGVWHIIQKSLHTKDIPFETEDYINVDHYDFEANKPIPLEPKKKEKKVQEEKNKFWDKLWTQFMIYSNKILSWLEKLCKHAYHVIKQKINEKKTGDK